MAAMFSFAGWAQTRPASLRVQPQGAVLLSTGPRARDRVYTIGVCGHTDGYEALCARTRGAFRNEIAARALARRRPRSESSRYPSSRRATMLLPLRTLP
jgi:hypothetical protein